jgi:D-glycero-alpha-D-manno-heptose 1-phosphate guanylyltransferase
MKIFSEAVILCGGLGSRLRDVTAEIPKSLVRIGSSTFLDVLTDELVRQGFTKIVLCVGYKKEKIKEHFKSKNNAEYIFSEEEFPLGTGGAILNAIRNKKIISQTFVVLNGDTFCDVNFTDMLYFHEKNKSELTMVIEENKTRNDAGMVLLRSDCRLDFFLEKDHAANRIQKNYVNCGVYVFNQTIFDNYENQVISLEKEMLPFIVIENICFGYKSTSGAIDIGTPERYWKNINFQYQGS